MRRFLIAVLLCMPSLSLAQSPDDLQRQRDAQQAYKENLNQYTLWQRDMIDQLMVEKARMQAKVKQLERQLKEQTCDESSESSESASSE